MPSPIEIEHLSSANDPQAKLPRPSPDNPPSIRTDQPTPTALHQTNNTMAPSRAPLTFLASALTRPRTCTHAANRTYPLASQKPLSLRRGYTRIPALLPALAPPSLTPSSTVVGVQSRWERRCYSSAAGSESPPSPAAAAADEGWPQPPDYLSEGERSVFEKVRGELRPVRLEVRLSFPSLPFPCVRNGPSATRPLSLLGTSSFLLARCLPFPFPLPPSSLFYTSTDPSAPLLRPRSSSYV